MLTEEELISICDAEISDIDSESDLSAERTRNMDFYMGDMGDYIPAGKDRSSVVTRDCLDTVESVLPSLLKIYTDAENAVEFIPNGPDDEVQAKMETDAVRTSFWEKNSGFLTLYSFIKDALISNTGVLKTYWEEGKYKREEYKGLNEEEAQKIVFSSGDDLEIIDYEENEGLIDLTIKYKAPGCIKCDCVPPEEFIISRNATSPDPKLSTFKAHRVEKTISDLIEMGFDRDIVEDLATGDEDYGQERLARRNRSDEQSWDSMSVHKSMRTVWITECYVNVDNDDDGIAELMRVTLAGRDSNYTLLESVEIDADPFVSITPVILTHKFYGFSLIDLVQDLQEIRTVLFRGILDNTYLSNNVRIAANEKVNIDDLLVSRAGGIVRTIGDSPPGNNVMPIVHPNVPPEAFGLLEVLDKMQKNRTGVGDEVAGLDSSALTNVNTGALAQAYDSARMRIELMARIIAELGLKPLFKDMHRLLHMNQSEMVQMQINGMWMDVTPTHWRDERSAKVTVGLGHYTREKKIQGLASVIALQDKAAQTGYKYITPINVHNAYSDLLSAQGINAEKYFMNPQKYQPPPAPPPPELEFKKAELQLGAQKIEIDKQKAATDSQVKILLAQSREREMDMKRKMEEMKGIMQLERMKVDEQNQVMRAMTDQQRAQYEIEVGSRSQEWKEAKETMDLKIKRQNLEFETYSTQLEAATKLETKLMDVQQKAEQSAAEAQQRAMTESLKHVREIMKMFQEEKGKETQRRDMILDFIKQNGSEKVKQLAGKLN